MVDRNQLAVAGHGRGPLMVNAGPGTGKTRCLTARFAALVMAGEAAPTDIVAVTFTREAAGVMRERVQRKIGRDVEGLRISTIHSLAYSILRYGKGRGPKVAVPEDAYEILQRAALEVDLPAVWDTGELFRLIAVLKERGINPEQLRPAAGPAASVFQEEVKRVYRRYQQILAEEGLLDFGGLILQAVERLRSDPSLRSYLRSLTPFVMVDEFQDTSPSQYEFIRHLVGDEQNLLVVGSPAQTIHEWRGVRMGELREAFVRDFHPPEITLHINYRSSSNIVAAASVVGEGYPDANQEGVREPGDPVIAWRPANQYDEAGRVAATVRRWLEEGISPGDIAVLYRTHRQADVLEAQLFASGIPYTLAGAERLYGRPEVRHLLAYLALALNPEQDGLEQVVNVPPRGLGPNTVMRIKGTEPILTLQALQAAARGRDGLPPRVVEAAAKLVALLDLLGRKARELPPRRMIDFTLGATGYREWAETQLLDGYGRIRAIAQVARDAEAFDSLDSFLEYAHRRAGEIGGDGICLSTIHAAKGREWAAVIATGLVEGLLPHARALKQGDAEIEEERRVLYVAMTRARDRLVLSAPQAWVGDTGVRETRPSRFLRIPGTLIELS
ncbi:MAG TPA: ATP-dependent helicase [Anaerolineales bacterium]|nr:ATP-dependent helicase [Anaerolineales bacterium]